MEKKASKADMKGIFSSPTTNHRENNLQWMGSRVETVVKWGRKWYFSLIMFARIPTGKSRFDQFVH